MRLPKCARAVRGVEGEEKRAAHLTERQSEETANSTRQVRWKLTLDQPVPIDREWTASTAFGSVANLLWFGFYKNQIYKDSSTKRLKKH